MLLGALQHLVLLDGEVALGEQVGLDFLLLGEESDLQLLKALLLGLVTLSSLLDHSKLRTLDGKFVVDLGSSEQRADLDVERPPRPVAKRDVGSSVTLDGAHSLRAVDQLVDASTADVHARGGLEATENVGQQVVATLLKLGKDASLEKDLGGTDGVGVGVELECLSNETSRLTPVHVALRDNAGH